MSWGVDCFVQGSCECRTSTPPASLTSAPRSESLSTVKISLQNQKKQTENNSHRLRASRSEEGQTHSCLWSVAAAVPSMLSVRLPESRHGKSFLSWRPVLKNTVPSLDFLVWAAVCVNVCICVCAGCGQKTSGSVTLRSSHCWERECVQSLTLGTWLSSSLALSRHWLLLTWISVSFCTAEKHRASV